MAKFIVNAGYTNRIEVNAESFVERGSFTEFLSDGEQVLAVRTELVKTITRAED